MEKDLKPELKSELYSLVKTVLKLYKKYEQGKINEQFFQKALRNAVDGILKINMYLKEKDISLPFLLHRMNFTGKYNKAIRIINKISILNTPDKSNGILKENYSHVSNKIKSSLLDLPGVTSEITSAFITLMDALKLDALQSDDLILRLFDELTSKLERFPGLKEIRNNVIQINNHVRENSNVLLTNYEYREKIGEHLYQIFNSFQNKLNLSFEE
ncbi:MAG: hypothetical protein GF353_24260 [Candidatus Lokiarchaeota archaeon]|nr:hypothetical protein [Candidatus Lokiarchaeota archaeon]